MQKYSMTCTCGHKMDVEAGSKDEAIAKLKEMMNQEAIDAHMKEKHAGDTAPTKEEVDMMIENNTMEDSVASAMA